MIRLVSLFLLFSSQNLMAKKFSNEFIEFRIPNSWECSLEGAEWICQNIKEDRKREAILIMAAKKRGAEDSLEQYESYLKRKKTFSLPGGKTQVSDPKYTKVIKINDHKWIDALHLASEIPGFYTRYLATVRHDVAVAVTLSVAKNYYNAYQSTFDKIVASMRVFRQGEGSSSDTPQYKVSKSKSRSALDETTFIPDDDERFNIKKIETAAPSSSSSDSSDLVFFLVLAGVVGAFIYLRKRK